MKLKEKYWILDIHGNSRKCIEIYSTLTVTFDNISTRRMRNISGGWTQRCRPLDNLTKELKFAFFPRWETWRRSEKKVKRPKKYTRIVFYFAVKRGLTVVFIATWTVKRAPYAHVEIATCADRCAQITGKSSRCRIKF